MAGGLVAHAAEPLWEGCYFHLLHFENRFDHAQWRSKRPEVVFEELGQLVSKSFPPHRREVRIKREEVGLAG